jgi:hypothetical protein
VTDPTTPEGRAELRRLCEAMESSAWTLKGPLVKDGEFISIARVALPAALDRIEELERELAEARKPILSPEEASAVVKSVISGGEATVRFRS